MQLPNLESVPGVTMTWPTRGTVVDVCILWPCVLAGPQVAQKLMLQFVSSAM